MSDYSTALMKSIYDYMLGCPLLKDGTFSVDGLPDNPVSYGIDYVPSANGTIKQYIDGSSVRIFNFVFASREFFDLETVQNLMNCTFYDEFAQWIESQDKAENFPTLGKGMYPRHLRVSLPGYLYSSDGESARYQIQLQLTYFKEA
jgi:hypothetical protein